MKLTDKEKHILMALAEFSSRGHDQCVLEAFIPYVYPGDVERPKNWRNALAVTVRNLGEKVQREGALIKRHSQLGRGHKATYKFTGDFACLLSSSSSLTPTISSQKRGE